MAALTDITMMLLVIHLVSFPLISAAYPFQNTSLSWEERVDDLVSRLTLDEMVLQMARTSPAPPIDRLGIKPYVWNSECLHGVVPPDGLATAFPQSIGLAASFSPDLLSDVAKAIGLEVRAKHNDYVQRGVYQEHTGLSCFSPVINIARHPLWGRNQETYGEDPFLIGELGSAYVRGLQGDHPRYVLANAGCKHFDVHGGPEDIPVSRFSFDAKVFERDWQMTFLPAFHECVKAGVYSVMCSYNRINEVPACANTRLLTDILRKEWGFDGYVVSDEGAVEFIMTSHHYTDSIVDTVASAVNAGCNLDLAFPVGDGMYIKIGDAVTAGKIKEKTVVERVKPLFYTRMRLGEFDPPELNPYANLNLSVVQSEEHRELAVKAALQSFVLFVLLKREGRVLPLDTLVNKLAVIGPFADNPSYLFGDYSPNPDKEFVVTPCKGLSNAARDTRCTPGCLTAPCTTYFSEMVKAAVTGADLIVVCLGTGVKIEAEFVDRSDLSLPGKQFQLLQDVVKYANGKPIILLLFNAGPLDIVWAVENPAIQVIVACFFPSQATGDALYRMFMNTHGVDTGNGNPGGRLPITWPRSMNQVPPMTNYTMEGRTYRYFNGDPLFPFGYGLSYGSFSYSSLVIWPSTIPACNGVKVSVTVYKLGPGGDEVTQVYMSWNNASVVVPKLQLVAFKRFYLETNGVTEVHFTIAPRMMAVYTDQWVIEPGVYTVYVGGQQPNQATKVPSNILEEKFTITDPITPLSDCKTANNKPSQGFLRK
ncbi:uncharacterized protein LOC100375243 [Saccoglossus kowalevskii]